MKTVIKSALCVCLTGCVGICTPNVHVHIPADFEVAEIVDSAKGQSVVLRNVKMTDLARERWDGATRVLQTGALAPILAR